MDILKLLRSKAVRSIICHSKEWSLHYAKTLPVENISWEIVSEIMLDEEINSYSMQLFLENFLLRLDADYFDPDLCIELAEKKNLLSAIFMLKHFPERTNLDILRLLIHKQNEFRDKAVKLMLEKYSDQITMIDTLIIWDTEDLASYYAVMGIIKNRVNSWDFDDVFSLLFPPYNSRSLNAKVRRVIFAMNHEKIKKESLLKCLESTSVSVYAVNLSYELLAKYWPEEIRRLENELISKNKYQYDQRLINISYNRDLVFICAESTDLKDYKKTQLCEKAVTAINNAKDVNRNFMSLHDLEKLTAFDAIK